MSKIHYSLKVQNLTIPVLLPEGTDTKRLDELTEKFNELIVTFNRGKPATLIGDQNTKLIIFSLLSFLMSPQFANSEKAPAPPAPSIPQTSDESKIIEEIQRLSDICDEALKR